MRSGIIDKYNTVLSGLLAKHRIVADDKKHLEMLTDLCHIVEEQIADVEDEDDPQVYLDLSQ
jgi:hypothetical protein